MFEHPAVSDLYLKKRCNKRKLFTLVIREAVAKSRATIAEVTVLAESLEGGAGPQIDKALQEAQTILQEIRSRNLVNRQTSAEQELREAIVLLGRMREEALPVRDNNVLVAGLTTRLKDLMNRVADLGIQMGKAEASSAAADALTARNRASASLGAVEDIQVIRFLPASSFMRKLIEFFTAKSVEERDHQQLPVCVVAAGEQGHGIAGERAVSSAQTRRRSRSRQHGQRESGTGAGGQGKRLG